MKRISQEMRNKLPGSLALVVTRAKQRSWYSINEAADRDRQLAGLSGKQHLRLRAVRAKYKEGAVLLHVNSSARLACTIFGKGRLPCQFLLRKHLGYL